MASLHTATRPVSDKLLDASGISVDRIPMLHVAFDRLATHCADSLRQMSSSPAYFSLSNIAPSRIDDVLARYHAGTIDRETAFIELAAICRDIASAHTGRDLHAHTLADIRREPRNPATRTGLDTLRMTIAALYPPEFADATVDTHAREVSVDDAAGWASTLVERWGR